MRVHNLVPRNVTISQLASHCKQESSRRESINNIIRSRVYKQVYIAEYVATLYDVTSAVQCKASIPMKVSDDM